jgi:predicted XRE-type DNA-binding protein
VAFPDVGDIKFIKSYARPFKWTRRKQLAALVLANAYNQDQAAKVAGVTQASISHWMSNTEFITEVDRLTLMVGISLRSERVRLAMQVLRQKTTEEGGIILTDKDPLDWLKFAQSETDGARIDLISILNSLESAEESGAPKPSGAETETKG